ncbi:MAG: tRNA uracil 4-sulfurtransferase ThiI, partial [Eubacteriales bacterium]
NLLKAELKKRLRSFGRFKIYSAQSTVYIEPLSEDADMDGAFVAAKNTFGVSAAEMALEVPKDMEMIINTVKTDFMPYIASCKTFKVEAKRSDKNFPLISPEICKEVGAAILEASRGQKKVNVHSPDVTVRVEIRDFAAYICAGQERAVGGMPQGSNGKGLLLLSGGIDSPVAGFMMAKRGVKIEALHFESFPYTSERAKEKVLSLAGKVAAYAGEIPVHIISVTHIQEVLRDTIDEDYFTLILRRFMMRLAMRVSEKYSCDALITGESMGQVASQTMQALAVTDIISKIPVFRPLIGNDKEDIIKIAREIDTFETSILPYEDCCTVFTPRHPRTRPELSKVEAEESKIDIDSLVDEAFETLYTVNVKADA